jgi:DNA-binding NarL/FixJ family response regulator
MPSIRVLLADDHAVVREGLKSLISQQDDMQVVGEASDGQTAHRLARQLAPDVVVMDVSMPELGGAAATAEILRDAPGCRVVALTVHEGEGYLHQLLQAGASGYVLKRSAAEDLVRAVREVAAGGTYLDPKAAGQILGSIVRPSKTSTLEQELTSRETEVVRLLARGHINREIAEFLDLSVKTVEVHKAKALEKLGLRSRADLVRYAIQHNWLSTD